MNSEENDFQGALQELRALPRPTMDLTTPEGAILCLEDAYRRRDIESAIACKDFEIEAVLLLLETMPEQASDSDVVAKTAEVLELAFRKELSENWPDMEGVESFFIDRQPGFQDLAIVVVTEISVMPDGSLSKSRLRVANRHNQWKVLNTLPEEEEDSRIRRYDTTSADSDLPEVEGRYSEQILRHIEHCWGKSEVLLEDEASDYVRVRVHLVRASNERPFHTLITSGMSDRPMTVPEGAEDYRLAELVICLPPNWPLDEKSLNDERYGWPIQWLRQLARFPHEYATWLFCGHTVPNGDPAEPFSPDTDFCCMLLGSPVLCSEEANCLTIDKQNSIQFYSLIPIHREEMDFALSNSSDDLLERLAEKEVTELLDNKRKSVCK